MDGWISNNVTVLVCCDVQSAVPLKPFKFMGLGKYRSDVLAMKSVC